MSPEFPVEILPHGKGYRITKTITYHSPRYNKDVTAEQGMYSDGASGPAIDRASLSWVFHDPLCKRKKWDDGTPCSNRQAAFVYYDILRWEGHAWIAPWHLMAVWFGRPTWNFIARLNPFRKG